MTEESGNTAVELSDALGQALRFRQNSLAAYILQADPYVPAGQEELLSVVRGIADEDRVLAEKLDARIREKGIPLAVQGPPGAWVTELNYLSIQYLVAVLKERLKHHVAVLEGLSCEQLRACGLEDTIADAIAVTKNQIERL